MYCSKLAPSFALILILSASHHFFLLHGQPPASSPSYRRRSTSSWNMSVQVNTSTTYSVSYPPEQSPPWPKDEFPSLFSLSPGPSQVSPSPPPPDTSLVLPSPTPSVSPPPDPSQVSPAPSHTEQPTITPPPEPAKSTTPTGLIAGAVTGPVVLIVVLFTCFFVWRKRRTRQSAQPQQQTPKDEEDVAPPSPSNSLGLGPRKFTYEELESATNGFSDSNFLGEGGFGVVHKGVLPYEETYVAIKQLKSGIQQAQREFLTEIRVTNRVHHKHLVSLVGYCINESHSKMMLVYEFVPNKTLAFHLHEKGTETIDWKTRMKIAIGSAKGLAYLHEECQPKIIHRDIKAANILIDDNFEPKVADFGLARFSCESQVMTRIMGSFGYLAPEYAASGKLSEKSDVFSFGVVLLELITGLKPVGDTETFPNGSMVEWARRMFSEALEKRNFEDIADEKLENHYEVEEMFRMASCAANCIRHSVTSRPPMSQVIQALEGVICLDNDLTTDENPLRRHLRQDLSKLRKMALGSYSTTYSDQLHYSTTPTSTSSAGSKTFI